MAVGCRRRMATEEGQVHDIRVLLIGGTSDLVDDQKRVMATG
jgi:hypothetical protein